jgi:hypothetical protein
VMKMWPHFLKNWMLMCLFSFYNFG